MRATCMGPNTGAASDYLTQDNWTKVLQPWSKAN